MAKAIDIVRSFLPNVTSCTDAKKDIRITVLASDGRGHRKDHRACAVAEACKRELHMDAAIISRTKAYLIKNNKATRYDIRKRVQAEILAFDRGGQMAPGEYTLHTPRQRPIEISSRVRGKKTGALKRARVYIPGLRKAVA